MRFQRTWTNFSNTITCTPHHGSHFILTNWATWSLANGAIRDSNRLNYSWRVLSWLTTSSSQRYHKLAPIYSLDNIIRNQAKPEWSKLVALASYLKYGSKQSRSSPERPWIEQKCAEGVHAWVNPCNVKAVLLVVVDIVIAYVSVAVADMVMQMRPRGYFHEVTTLNRVNPGPLAALIQSMEWVNPGDIETSMYIVVLVRVLPLNATKSLRQSLRDYQLLHTQTAPLVLLLFVAHFSSTLWSKVRFRSGLPKTKTKWSESAWRCPLVRSENWLEMDKTASL